MGNDTSKPSSRMAISALSHMMRITKSQLLALRDKCLSVSETGEDVHTKSGYRLTQAKFRDAMTDMNVAIEPDCQVLEKLFVMWDRNGENWVDPLEFFSGIGPLASVMDVGTKLTFSLELYDYNKTGRISREGLVTVLEAINATSSYFGDAVLQKTQVAVIADDIFADEGMLEDDNAIAYSDKVYKMTNHPLVAEFISGAGTSRYGTETAQ
mmetsp:Transcript_988/g.2069  ORF Transcript_988/g.2069 Transcript_988/m.2069 type:complete len:211 (-) Transcript_988:1167-1799(-)|eukprot:CAMPEP_0172307418 /NCGR_PEP_ID=MMETSP1058-20130122/8289_1 /TAXON_ID=83371 /ORGANISM="Detonula confervacea, Strain CCMP 353" /LENGTH=210 /DNA_ID=CAMNT_0013019583 /DNA_START=81 /DNA_END=713 /DNA_ORIENTATION=-